MRIRIEAHTLPGRNPGSHRDVQVVQGKRGERFIYLTWLEGPDATMFRRAKLMLAGAPEAPSVTAHVNLTDEWGLPRCARLSTSGVEWSRGPG
ncbi:MAG: hypothetical protein JWN68_3301 [Nocardioides sp.]|jgi:hypothetical protein|uniref:DUF5990 family protein n=1 Tax=Nocardioides sp. TaxID=35761 RepID=UPI002628E6DA|nr:DUF5990 family protein [Nocardioides sp.]MCW2835348.1 hypothetical protein [Nocardioides sp.]